MSATLAWKLNRLRTMSAAEIRDALRVGLREKAIAAS